MTEKNQNDPTPLSELGEFKLIQELTEDLKSVNDSTLLGVGDDAAVIDAGEGMVKLVTTDMLCEGVHFDLLYTPVKHLGYKAVVVNLSDIYAMNGSPEQITISIGASNRISVEFLEELYEGIKLACKHYSIDLVGGDTVSSSALTISITAIGSCKKEDVVYRNGAKSNDLLCVSGDLGAAYMGLQILEREKAIYQENQQVQPDLSGFDYILERQLKPEARYDVILRMSEMGVKPTSMIDISDGLSSEVLHLCQASGLGCSLYEEKIPIDPTTVNVAEQFKIGAVTAALNGGEDYELLFTVSINDHEKIKEMEGVSVVGHMNGKNEAANFIGIGDSVIPLTARGWEGFTE